MEICKINNINFQAKLDISKIKTNKTRWENVSNIFAELTKKQPDGLIKLSENKTNLHILSGNKHKNFWMNSLSAILEKKQAQELMNTKSDYSIANILKKFYNLGISSKNELIKADKFATKMAETSDNICNRNYSDTYDYFYEEAFSIIENKIRDKTNKDNIMKNWIISI